LKITLLEKYGLVDYEKKTQRMMRVFNRVKFHGEYYEGTMIGEMEDDLMEYFDDTIENILAMEKVEFEDISVVLMKNIDDMEGFVIMWREHFLEVAKPQHIHQKWVDNIKII